MYAAPVDYIVIGLQLVVALATIAAALATRRQAKNTERALLLRMRPLIRADWSVISQGQFQATLAATVSETAGVPTELRGAHTRVLFMNDFGEDTRSLNLSGTLLHGTASTATVPFYVDLNRAGTRGFGHFVTAELTLTVCAVGIEEPHTWKMEGYVSDAGNGRITISAMPGAACTLMRRESKPTPFHRLAELWGRWEAWNERCRRLEH